MSDRDRYIEFLHSLGFKQKSEGGTSSIYTIADDEYLVLGNEIYLGSGKGYSGFFSWFEFDESGKFVTHGAAE